MKKVKLRPHHLMCISRFSGGMWYSKVYEKNFKDIYRKIKSNPRIKIIKGCDDICKKCPHQKSRICQKRPKINYWIKVMDNKVIKKLSISENQVFGARDIFNFSRKIKNSDVKQICRGCEYLGNCLKNRFNRSLFNSLNN